jgi:hypothetical protein
MRCTFGMCVAPLSVLWAAAMLHMSPALGHPFATEAQGQATIDTQGSAAERLTGTLEAPVVDDQVMQVTYRYTQLRLADGDVVALRGAPIDDVPAGTVVELTGSRNGVAFAVSTVVKGCVGLRWRGVPRGDPLASRMLSKFYYFVLRKVVLPGYPTGGFDLALMPRAMLEPLRDSAKNAYLPLLISVLSH